MKIVAGSQIAEHLRGGRAERIMAVVEPRARRVRVVGGRELLVRQGALSFELFTGHAAPIEIMRRAAGAR